MATQQLIRIEYLESGVVTPPVVEIGPTRGWVSLRFGEFWSHRELLYFFVWRDVKVRYKQTVLGVAWAILQPLFTMVIFSLFFGRLAKVPSDGIPYPLFSFAALVPWTFFATGLQLAANSLVGSANLITKVYFPRLIVPVAAVLSGLVDFALAFVLLLLMMIYMGYTPAATVIALPLFFLLAFATALGAGLWLAALNVRFRDVRYILPFLTQAWMFATPIAYPSSLLHEPWRSVYALNPMVGVVDSFRWALLRAPAPSSSSLLVSSVVAVAMLTTGAFYFRRMERTFADVV